MNPSIVLFTILSSQNRQLNCGDDFYLYFVDEFNIVAKCLDSVYADDGEYFYSNFEIRSCISGGGN